MTATLVQLETFVRVAELQNYTRVAEELHLTQPGVGQQVRALERQFGVKLVDIVHRRPILTEGGAFLAARAGDVLGTMAALEREMREFAAARSGELHVGATLTIGTYVLPERLARFAKSNPGVRVHVEVANTSEMAKRIQSGNLSLALVEGPLADEGLSIEAFQSDELVLVLPPNHQYADKRIVASDLEREPFIWREQGSGTRAIAETALGAAGVYPPVILELPSGEGVARAVEAGLGVTILSRLVVERAVEDGRLATAEVVDLNLARTLRLATVHGRTLSPAARAFRLLLLSAATDHGEPRDGP
jgi:DNA-binding transcriptional LysR family regulator